MGHIEFLREGLKNLKTVGTLTRSSKFLCKGMIKHIDFSEADLIVELGAGDGVITEFILEAMKAETELVAFEVNGKFCDVLRSIGDDRLIVAEDSAEKLAEYLQQTKQDQVDYIISAIPFVSLPKELGYTIVQECYRHLKKGGLFIQVHYSLLAKNIYESIFGNVDINFIPINVPPAFVLVSEKK